MRRRHMIDLVNKKQMSFCGHEMTQQEFRFAKDRELKHINCKRCLDKYTKFVTVLGDTLDQLLS